MMHASHTDSHRAAGAHPAANDQHVAHGHPAARSHHAAGPRHGAAAARPVAPPIGTQAQALHARERLLRWSLWQQHSQLFTSAQRPSLRQLRAARCPLSGTGRVSSLDSVLAASVALGHKVRPGGGGGGGAVSGQATAVQGVQEEQGVQDVQGVQPATPSGTSGEAAVRKRPGWLRHLAGSLRSQAMQVRLQVRLQARPRGRA